jgi:hypothetical protein
MFPLAGLLWSRALLYHFVVPLGRLTASDT